MFTMIICCKKTSFKNIPFFKGFTKMTTCGSWIESQVWSNLSNHLTFFLAFPKKTLSERTSAENRLFLAQMWKNSSFSEQV